MFAYLGLTPQEVVLLFLIAVVMVVGPVVAAVLGLAMMRRHYGVKPGGMGNR